MASGLLVAGVRKAFTSPGRGPWARSQQMILDGIDLEVKAGEAVALVGTNGAGKTTLLRIVASLLTPDAGTVQLDGEPVAQASARSRVGLASGDERAFYLRLSARENLRFFAALHGLGGRAFESRLGPLTSALDLGDLLAKRVGACSAGMRARLGLARAMLHEPSLLVLDEPTKSLDPAHAVQVHAALRRALAGGTMVLLATHGADPGPLQARVFELVAGRLRERRG